MEFYDKDGIKIDLKIPLILSEKNILKINDIPESSVVKTDKGYKFLYNTILRDLKNIKEEIIIDKEDKNEETFFIKKMIFFNKQGELVRNIIHMDKKRFFKNIGDKFVNTILENKIIKENDKIILGYSGGTDCSILLDLLINNRDKLPKFELIAVTIGSLAGTKKREFINNFCNSRGIHNFFIEEAEIVERFNLNNNLDKTINKFLSSEKQLSINFIQHMIKIMLEDSAKKLGVNKIMLGLERETIVTSLLSFYLSGDPLLGLYTKSDGEFEYLFPLASLLKKEEYAYMIEQMKDYSSLSKKDISDSKLDRLHSNDWRGSIMLLAGHLLDLFPGIDYYMEEAFNKMNQSRPQIFGLKKCSNCKGSFIMDKVNEDICPICQVLKELNLVKN